MHLYTNATSMQSHMKDNLHQWNRGRGQHIGHLGIPHTLTHTIYVHVRSPLRAVYRNFAEGGRIWGMDKRGGARRVEAQ